VWLLVLPAAGCMGPAPKDHYVTCATNETMVVIALPNENQQAKVDSREALEKGEIKHQRYKLTMSKHDYGWNAGCYQWVADEMVIIVDRSPVSVELTKDPYTGDSPKDEALEVSSADGLKVALGATASAYIDEADALTYVYYYGVVHDSERDKALISDESQLAELKGFSDTEKLLFQSGLIDKQKSRVPYVTYTFRARPLDEVLRSEIIGFCQAKLSEDFNTNTLGVGKARKTDYFKDVFEDARKFFKKRGITLTAFGSTKGLQYENTAVQGVIDDRFAALNAIAVALQDESAQKKTNERLIAQAQADRDAAIQFLANYPAARQEFEIELRKILAERQEILRQGWDGRMPANLLPAGQAAPGGPQLLLQPPQASHGK
jgi:hypothetical protein